VKNNTMVQIQKKSGELKERLKTAEIWKANSEINAKRRQITPKVPEGHLSTYPRGLNVTFVEG
jgi:hypothetical protein